MSVKIVRMNDSAETKRATRASTASPRRQAKKEVSASRSPAAKRSGASSGEREADAPRQRPYHHGNLREELVRCGKQQLVEVGLTGLSLRQIAAKVGVSQVAPKHHFGNKEGLLAAIAASGFRDLTEFRFSRLRPKMSAEQRLRSLLSSYVTFACNHPTLFQLMFGPQFPARQIHAELEAATTQSYHTLARAVVDYMAERGKEDETRALEMARIAWMCMHGVSTLMIDFSINPVGAPRVNRQQLIDQALDLVFAGIRGVNGI